jgi:GNAT superfamily N-acetyltransferase
MAVTIHRFAPEDWERFRDIRLRMVEELPLAYGERLEDARALTDAQWMERVRGYTVGDHIRVAAVHEPSGEWVGTMGGFLSAEDGDRPVLVSVYVAPAFRGSDVGVTDALLRAIEDWARGHGDTLLLHVHEDNARARAAYAKRGFVEDGRTEPYQLDPSRVEYRMAKAL